MQNDQNHSGPGSDITLAGGAPSGNVQPGQTHQNGSLNVDGSACSTLGQHPQDRSGKLLKGTEEVTSQTQFVHGPSWPRPLCVDEWRAALIGGFAGGVAAAAQQGEADRQDAVPHCPGVSPRTGEEEEEELQVRHQED